MDYINNQLTKKEGIDLYIYFYVYKYLEWIQIFNEKERTKYLYIF